MGNSHGSTRWNRRGRYVSALVAIVILLTISINALAQETSAAQSAQTTQAQQIGPSELETQSTLHLLVGRSLVITSPTRIKRVSVADPTIADAVVISPYQLLINGKKAGGVSLVLWNEADQSQTFELLVDLDILGLSQKIREVFPGEPVKVEAAKDAVMLSGQVSSPGIADKILEVAKTASPKLINLMQIPIGETGQISLQVKFAEVDRTALTQYGFNIFSTGAANTIGTTTTQQFGGFGQQVINDTKGVKADPLPDVFVPSTGSFHEAFETTTTITDVLNLFIFRPDIHLGTVIKALQQRNLLQILAEPNLLTQSGKEASFLAGGEFPFPVLQGTAVGGSQGVTIQFKEFGVRLNFLPTILPDGTIHLKVKPEVSALDFTNALTVSGFFIPALSTRRVETEMDLRDGQSFAIAGLVDNRVTEVANKIPGLGDIPIFGKLFKSRALNKSRTELLVMVTPRIVKPFAPGQEPSGPQFPKSFLPPAEAEKDAKTPGGK